MVIQRKILIDALRACMPGIKTEHVDLKGVDSFVFYKGRVYSYNDNIAVSVPLETFGMVDEEIEGAVHAKEFYALVTKFSGDEINFSTSDNGSWFLKSGRAKVELTLMDFDYARRLDGITPDEKNWQNIESDFVAGLAVCKMDGNKSNLKGVYVKEDTMVSTDGYQINKYVMKSSKLPNFWISDNSANELVKINKLNAVQLQGNWAHFRAMNGSVFSVKVQDIDKFPFERTLNILDKASQESTLQGKFPKAIFDVIDRAKTFSISLDEHLTVKLVISKKDILVSSERESGKYSEKVSWDEEVKGDFETLTVYVDPEVMCLMAKRTLEFYVQKFVKANQKVVPRLLFKTESSTHLMATFSGDDE